jgi:hypothetical protein
MTIRAFSRFAAMIVLADLDDIRADDLAVDVNRQAGLGVATLHQQGFGCAVERGGISGMCLGHGEAQAEGEQERAEEGHGRS